MKFRRQPGGRRVGRSQLVAASGPGRLPGLGDEGPGPDVAVVSAADAALLGHDQVTLSTRVLIPPMSLQDAAYASLGATPVGARPPGHRDNILRNLQISQITSIAMLAVVRVILGGHKRSSPGCLTARFPGPTYDRRVGGQVQVAPTDQTVRPPTWSHGGRTVSPDALASSPRAAFRTPTTGSGPDQQGYAGECLVGSTRGMGASGPPPTLCPVAPYANARWAEAHGCPVEGVEAWVSGTNCAPPGRSSAAASEDACAVGVAGPRSLAHYPRGGPRPQAAARCV